MEDWMVVVGSAICACALWIWLFRIARRGRSRGNGAATPFAAAAGHRNPPALPAQPSSENDRRAVPPPLPGERAAADPRIFDYPKCPVDRMRNAPGRPQVVFWNAERRCYCCARGHRFTGREH